MEEEEEEEDEEDEEEDSFFEKVPLNPWFFLPVVSVQELRP